MLNGSERIRTIVFDNLDNKSSFNLQRVTVNHKRITGMAFLFLVSGYQVAIQ
jgi:hypothetical protein